MYIPDLFGAYVKGRELAIAKNWDDLKNFESVENARNQNDLNAMDIWERRQQMPGKMNMFYNNADISQMNTDVAREAHPGLIANARTGSLHAQDRHAIFLDNRDYGRNVANHLYRANLGMLDAAGQNKAGQANFWLTDNRAYDAGDKTGQITYDTLRGNSITTAHYPTVAQQQNTQGDLTYRNNVAGLNLGYDQIKNSHELVPQQHELAKTTLGNQQADASGYQARQEASQIAGMQQQEFDRHRLLAEMMDAQAPGSGTSYLMGVMGIDKQTSQTQNSEPTGTPQTNLPVWSIRSLLPPMFQNPNGGQVYNYPVSPEYGQYRPLVSTPTPTPTPQEVQQQQLINRLSGSRQGGIL